MYTEILRLVKLSLTRKRINFPGMATMSHTNILRIFEIQMFFSNIKLDRSPIEDRRPAIINFMFDLKDTIVFLYKAAIHIYIYIFYLGWFWGSKVKCNENCKRKFCSVRILFTNVTLPYMSHIIGVGSL